MTRSRTERASKSQPHRLTLTGELTLKSVADIRERVREALSAHAHVTAEIATDAVVDLSFVQLIESARKSAAAANKTFSLAAPAAGGLLEVLRRGGFLTDRDAARRDFWTFGGEPQR